MDVEQPCFHSALEGTSKKRPIESVEDDAPSNEIDAHQPRALNNLAMDTCDTSKPTPSTKKSRTLAAAGTAATMDDLHGMTKNTPFKYTDAQQSRASTSTALEKDDTSKPKPSKKSRFYAAAGMAGAAPTDVACPVQVTGGFAGSLHCQDAVYVLDSDATNGTLDRSTEHLPWDIAFAFVDAHTSHSFHNRTIREPDTCEGEAVATWAPISQKNDFGGWPEEYRPGKMTDGLNVFDVASAVSNQESQPNRVTPSPLLLGATTRNDDGDQDLLTFVSATQPTGALKKPRAKVATLQAAPTTAGGTEGRLLDDLGIPLCRPLGARPSGADLYAMATTRKLCRSRKVAMFRNDFAEEGRTEVYVPFQSRCRCLTSNKSISGSTVSSTYEHVERTDKAYMDEARDKMDSYCVLAENRPMTECEHRRWNILKDFCLEAVEDCLEAFPERYKEKYYTEKHRNAGEKLFVFCNPVDMIIGLFQRMLHAPEHDVYVEIIGLCAIKMYSAMAEDFCFRSASTFHSTLLYKESWTVQHQLVCLENILLCNG